MKTRAHCPKCGTPLSEHSYGEFCPRCALLGAISLGDQPQTDLEAESPHPTAQRDLDDYDLLEEIGRGGMGVVFKARQKSLNRIVAVKMLLHGRFADPAFRRRFRLEAEAAAHLEHPNIVPIHEIGERAGQPFFSMGWVDGHSLDRELADGPLPPERCAHLVATLAHAVHHAHKHGILHRDLKPHNVIIDAEGEPHLTDFGLAKLIESDTGLTLTQTVLGSPGFVAPEQAAGQNARVTTAADVFSLGAILYMMLTGVPPFSGESPIAILRKVIESDPPPPRSVNPTLPRDLETICLKCLQKEPERRYGSAEALAADLERWIKNEPILARPVDDLERLGLWCRRRPWRAGLSAALIVAVLVGGIGISSQWRRAEEASRRAEAGQLAAEQGAYAARISLAQMLARQGRSEDARTTLLEARPESLRGWEWGWLMRQSSQDMMTLGADGKGQNDCAFSPDGQFIITGGEDGAVRIWNVQTPSDPEVLRGGGDSPILSLTVSPDRAIAVTAHQGEPAKVWDLNNRKLTSVLTDRSSWITKVAFSPDGETIATGAFDGSVRIRNREDVDSIQLSSHYDDGPILALNFSPDGKQLAYSGGSADPAGERPISIGIIDLDTGAVRRLHGHTSSVRALAFSPDGQWLATAGDDGTARITRCRGEDPLRIIQSLRQGYRYTALLFNPDSRHLMVAGTDSVIGLVNEIDLISVSSTRRMDGLPLYVRSMSLSPDGQQFATTTGDGIVRLWPVNPHPSFLNLVGHDQDVWAVAVSPDGRYAASGSLDHTARIWEMETGRIVNTIQVDYPVVSVAFTADSRNLVTNAPGNTAKVWPIDGQGAVVELRGHEGLVFAVAVDPRGRWIATGSRDMTARLWDATTGETLRVYSHDLHYVASIAFSPDGERLAAGSMAGQSAVWETRTGRLVCRMDGHRRGVTSIQFSLDGSRLATGGIDGNARIWDPDTGNPIGHPLESTTLGIMTIAFSPDGNRLLTTDTRGMVSRVHPRCRTVTLWNVADGRRLWEFQPHNAGTFALAFSPDGTRIVTGGGDNTARIWTAFPWKMEDYPRTADNTPASRLESFKRTFWSHTPDPIPYSDRQIEVRSWGEKNLPRTIPTKTRPALPIPPRPSGVDPGQIDLSAVYNSALNEVWQPVMTIFTLDGDLAALPPGRHVSGGILFDLRGVIQLRSDLEEWTHFPGSVDIPIDRKIQRFHVVQAAASPSQQDRDGETVGAYRIHFENGEVVRLPIIYGSHLRSFWKEQDMVDECSNAVLVWQWKEPARSEISKYHRLFMATFENPRPELRVSHIEFVTGETVVAPFLVGMTVE